MTHLTGFSGKYSHLPKSLTIMVKPHVKIRIIKSPFSSSSYTQYVTKTAYTQNSRLFSKTEEKNHQNVRIHTMLPRSCKSFRVRPSLLFSVEMIHHYQSPSVFGLICKAHTCLNKALLLRVLIKAKLPKSPARHRSGQGLRKICFH